MTGEFLAEKECRSCKAGSAVLLSLISTAGVTFEADAYSCQSCPDPSMSFNALGECACATGYTLVRYLRSDGFSRLAVIMLMGLQYQTAGWSTIDWAALLRSIRPSSRVRGRHASCGFGLQARRQHHQLADTAAFLRIIRDKVHVHVRRGRSQRLPSAGESVRHELVQLSGECA